ILLSSIHRMLSSVSHSVYLFFLHTPPPPDLYPLSLHDALPIYPPHRPRLRGELGRTDRPQLRQGLRHRHLNPAPRHQPGEYLRRSEEHTSELQSRFDLVCRLLLEKKKKTHNPYTSRSKIKRVHA